MDILKWLQNKRLHYRSKICDVQRTEAMVADVSLSSAAAVLRAAACRADLH